MGRSTSRASNRPDAGLAGLRHYFVEQGGNFTHDPLRSVADSADYVKRVLLK